MEDCTEYWQELAIRTLEVALHSGCASKAGANSSNIKPMIVLNMAKKIWQQAVERYGTKGWSSEFVNSVAWLAYAYAARNSLDGFSRNCPECIINDLQVYWPVPEMAAMLGGAKD